MILERWESISEATLIDLCETKAPETATLDFKQELYGSNPDDKAEFMKDVCAFANAEGGDFVFGIAEAKGVAGCIKPITSMDADKAMRRMGQTLDGSVEPRLTNLQWKPVPVDGGYVLILRVPKSLIGPHRFVVSNLSRFPIRTGTHIADMSYEQLRTAFDRTATLADRAKAFRETRIDAIAKGETLRSLTDTTCAIVHILPLSSFSGQASVDVLAANIRFNDLAPNRWPHVSRSLNLDGLLMFGKGDRGELLFYSQLYRNGIVETFQGAMSFVGRDNKVLIPSLDLARFVRDAVERGVKAINNFGSPGGAFIGLSMLNVQGELGIGTMFNMLHKTQTDRPHLVLPEIWVENTLRLNLDEVTRQLCDVLWQCFGVERCSYFLTDGTWNPNAQPL